MLQLVLQSETLPKKLRIRKGNIFCDVTLCIVRYHFTEVSEEITASIFRIKICNQATRKKQSLYGYNKFH
jgi:hypothetical protein